MFDERRGTENTNHRARVQDGVAHAGRERTRGPTQRTSGPKRKKMNPVQLLYYAITNR